MSRISYYLFFSTLLILVLLFPANSKADETSTADTDFGSVAYSPPLYNPIIFTNSSGADVYVTSAVLTNATDSNQAFFITNTITIEETSSASIDPDTIETGSDSSDSVEDTSSIPVLCTSSSEEEGLLLADGESCYVMVGFQPIATDQLDATVTFYSNSTVLDQKTLTGTGQLYSCEASSDDTSTVSDEPTTTTTDADTETTEIDEESASGSDDASESPEEITSTDDEDDSDVGSVSEDNSNATNEDSVSDDNNTTEMSDDEETPVRTRSFFERLFRH